MKLRARFLGNFRRLFFLIGTRRQIHGVEVGVSFFCDEPSEVIFTKIEEAVGLIQEYDSRQYARLRRHARLLVFGTIGPNGEWFGTARLIRLDSRYVMSSTTRSEHLAALIVHEVTHAWLDHLGFDYCPERRRRLEAICIRSESNFAKRLPGGAELSSYYQKKAEDVLAQPDHEWSNAAFKKRDAERLLAIGAPSWLVRLLYRST